MRRPRGHFRVTDGDLLTLAMVLFIAVGIPVLSIGALVVMPILRIWYTFSWFWLLIPAGVLAVWWAFVGCALIGGKT